MKKLRFARSFLANRLVHVNLQILYSCNCKCAICDFWKPSWAQKPMLSTEQAGVISGKLNRIGSQIISVGGGEPLLHPELLGIVRTLARHHFPVMITNGSLMTRGLARELWAAGLVEISVSVDYASAEKHEAQRGKPGIYARALEALAMLHAGRTRPEQRVNMISVIMDDNLDDVEPLLKICGQLGITYLVTLYSQSRGAKARKDPPMEVAQRLLELKRRHRQFVALRGYLARLTEAIARNGIGPCHAGQNLCNIDTQGDVGLCIDRLDEPVGNILTDDVLVLEQLLRNRARTNQCRDCWTSCRGSIEALRHGEMKLGSLLDYYRMTRPVALKSSF